MKIGITAGYWGSGPPIGVEQQLREAEALGVDSFWTAEAYGSDALTPLAWWGSRTSSIKLGTSICQMAARTPTALAMAAMTLDHLSEGRVILGIGASGPQVVEGWYGQAYPKPLERTREYVEIMRQVMSREAPVSYEGRHYQLPLDGGAHLGKPLKSTIHPYRESIPIYLAAEGPKNVALAAEIADGWLPLWFSPKSDDFYRAALREGFSREGAHSSEDSFEVACTVWLIEHPDVDVPDHHDPRWMAGAGFARKDPRRGQKFLTPQGSMRTPGFNKPFGSTTSLAARSWAAKSSGRSLSYAGRWSRPTAW